MTCDKCPWSCRRTSICNVYEPPKFSYKSIISAKIIYDYIERFDFYHFKPGKRIAMIIPYGCNLFCTFCHEYETVFGSIHQKKQFSEILNILTTENFDIIGFYCNSTVHLNFMKKLSKFFSDRPIVALSNGIISEKYLEEYLSFLDAINIVFLGFDAYTYARFSIFAEAYKLAIRTLEHAIDNIHTEVSFLVIPGITSVDSFLNFLNQLERLNRNIPLHLKRFYPSFVELDRRPTRTRDLMHFYNIAKKHLHYVYADVWGIEPNHTFCPNGHLVIKRLGWKIIKNYLKDNKCPKCGVELPIRL